jgi:esterase/lipase superfamily enzyme
MRLIRRNLAGGNFQFNVRTPIAIAAIVAAGAIMEGCKSKTYLMPTPNVYTHPEWNLFADVPPALQSDTVSVMYVTDRVPTKETTDHWTYGYARSRSASFGEAVVKIGDKLSWDDVVAASRTDKRPKKLELSIATTNEVARFDKTPPMLLISDVQMASTRPAQIDSVQIEAEKRFLDELSRRMAKTPRKEILVYVHGFNNTFDDAVLTTAELWHFLGREGVPICYTWPAGEGLLKAYEYTLDSTQFTVYHFKQMLRLIASHPDVRKINVIAHSRGTAVLTDTVRELYLEAKCSGDARNVLKIGTVVLAAADIDLDVVIQRDAAERVGRAVDFTAVYFSNHDKALGFSSWLTGGILRLGDINFKMFDKQEIAVLRQIKRSQLINAKVKDLGDFNHSYFHSSPSVSSDIVLLMRFGLLPGAENGRPLSVSDEGYWVLEQGYPGNDWTLPKWAMTK